MKYFCFSQIYWKEFNLNTDVRVLGRQTWSSIDSLFAHDTENQTQVYL